MYSMVNTAVVEGIHTIPIHVEVDISAGMPMFDMVGYLSSEVREAKERVRTALHNCGILLPAKRITMNLSPANIKKTGTGFDLPIAVALLCALERVRMENCRNRIFVGELSLSGKILPVNGILPIVADGWKAGVKEFVVPLQNRREAQLVKGVKVYAFSELTQLISFLRDGRYREQELEERGDQIAQKEMDFAEVNGQHFLKRACEVAAAGMHNMLMIGPPGAGKTMISERLGTILPALTEEEKMELSKIYSVCGLLDNSNSLQSSRPFRSPHHTVTRTGLIGGGYHLHPGEISLAHKGVLFLDELPEFSKDTIEALRQPLEEHRVHLTRASGSVVYPSDFLLLAAMNPCSCGYYPDMQKCRCTPVKQKSYLSRISQPIIDRIDICVQAMPLSYQELTQKGKEESSEVIRKRVENCHRLQQERYQQEDFSYNSQIPPSKLAEVCALGEKEAEYMEHIYNKMELTGRTYHKILRVARSIADLEGCPNIKLAHLNEAVCYRSMDERFWRAL